VLVRAMTDWGAKQGEAIVGSMDEWIGGLVDEGMKSKSKNETEVRGAALEGPIRPTS
jgi:hypothetical protein